MINSRQLIYEDLICRLNEAKNRPVNGFMLNHQVQLLIDALEFSPHTDVSKQKKADFLSFKIAVALDVLKLLSAPSTHKVQKWLAANQPTTAAQYAFWRYKLPCLAAGVVGEGLIIAAALTFAVSLELALLPLAITLSPVFVVPIMVGANLLTAQLFGELATDFAETLLNLWTKLSLHAEDIALLKNTRHEIATMAHYVQDAITTSESATNCPHYFFYTPLAIPVKSPELPGPVGETLPDQTYSKMTFSS